MFGRHLAICVTLLGTCALADNTAMVQTQITSRSTPDIDQKHLDSLVDRAVNDIKHGADPRETAQKAAREALDGVPSLSDKASFDTSAFIAGKLIDQIAEATQAHGVAPEAGNASLSILHNRAVTTSNASTKKIGNVDFKTAYNKGHKECAALFREKFSFKLNDKNPLDDSLGAITDRDDLEESLTKMKTNDCDEIVDMRVSEEWLNNHVDVFLCNKGDTAAGGWGRNVVTLDNGKIVKDEMFFTPASSSGISKSVVAYKMKALVEDNLNNEKYEAASKVYREETINVTLRKGGKNTTYTSREAVKEFLETLSCEDVNIYITDVGQKDKTKESWGWDEGAYFHTDVWSCKDQAVMSSVIWKFENDDWFIKAATFDVADRKGDVVEMPLVQERRRMLEKEFNRQQFDKVLQLYSGLEHFHVDGGKSMAGETSKQEEIPNLFDVFSQDACKGLKFTNFKLSPPASVAEFVCDGGAGILTSQWAKDGQSDWLITDEKLEFKPGLTSWFNSEGTETAGSDAESRKDSAGNTDAKTKSSGDEDAEAKSKAAEVK